MLNIKDRLYIATFQINALEVAAKYGVGIEFNHTCISQALDSENRSGLLSKMKSDLAAAGAIGTTETATTVSAAGTASREAGTTARVANAAGTVEPEAVLSGVSGADETTEVGATGAAPRATTATANATGTSCDVKKAPAGTAGATTAYGASTIGTTGTAVGAAGAAIAGASGTTAGVAVAGTTVTSAGAPRATLHGPFTEIHPAAIDYRFRNLAKQRLNQAFEICSALSVKNMIVHSGWVPFIYFKEWQAERGAEFWQDFMADKPEDFNIYVENVMEDEPYMMADFMAHVTDSRIRLCLDIGHANAATSKDISIETWIKVLGPYIGHFHLHNNDGTGDAHGDFEAGTMDMVSVFNAIEKHCSPDVTFTIEARQCGKCMEWLQNHRYI